MFLDAIIELLCVYALTSSALRLSKFFNRILEYKFSSTRKRGTEGGLTVPLWTVSYIPWKAKLQVQYVLKISKILWPLLSLVVIMC
jgi:hypothetical protein